MNFSIYNSLSGKKELFEPTDPENVRVYNCGPTVYNTQHIGNLRRYVISDLLYRTLNYAGYTVNNVTNITDVGHLTNDEEDSGEDKMVVAAKREKKSPDEIATEYTNVFFRDLRDLNVLSVPENDITNSSLPIKGWPRATEHIEHMLNIVAQLLSKDIAYSTSHGVYFDISKIGRASCRERV